MTELNQILQRYGILVDTMSELEKEVPIIEKIYKELKSTIEKQSQVADDSLTVIKNQANESIEKAKVIEDAVEVLEKKHKQIESDIKKAKKENADFLKLVDEKIETLTELVKNTNNFNVNSPEIDSRLSYIESKLSKIERQSTQNNSTNNQSTSNSTVETNTNIYRSAKRKFPEDAQHFTFDKIKHVSRKKPQGIVIEGNIIKVKHWTSLIETVIPYAINKYNVNIEDLADRDYRYSYYGDDNESTIPYFVYDNPDELTSNHRYIKECDLHVYSGGADRTVELLNILLCDYLNINPKNIELFYN